MPTDTPTPDIERIADAAIAHVREAIRPGVAGAGDPPQRPPLDTPESLKALVAEMRNGTWWGSTSWDRRAAEALERYAAHLSMVPAAGTTAPAPEPEETPDGD